ncbi:hypothetical protein [Bacillus sp. PS06]|uniref:hypothetical protein n=1 Tax=Bacillus sp. PS06 TaxID=2764176 RepID=UPI00177D70D7|nr:hypothetical protein [Bacillus sp. PS06]MBD8067837.1 hypothetical protein [Bacillus sp. PS06]
MISIEKKQYYLTSALVIVLFGGISFFFLPMVLQDIMYRTTSTWFIQTPSVVIKLYFVTIACWAIASLLIYFFWKKAIIPSILLFIAGLIVIVLSVNNYQLMSDNHIAWSELKTFEEKSYSWSEVNELQSIPNENGKGYTIKVNFSDGESIAFKRDTNFNANYWRLQEKMVEHNLPFVGVEQE